MSAPFYGRPDAVRIKGDGDYASKLAQAQALQDNAFIFGMQQAFEQGGGAAISANRHPKYANSNFTTGDVMDGAAGNFKPQRDTAGNSVLTDFNNQSGFGPGPATSATTHPQVDPRMLGQDAEARVAMMQQGIQYPGYNNRQQTYQA